MTVLVLSVAMVLGGLVWLSSLRSRGSSWKDALYQRQIQGFNGLTLVGIGMITAILAAVDLVPALAPYRDVIRFVITPIWVMCMVWVAGRLLPRGGGAASP